MFIFYKELTLEEGFKFLNSGKSQRTIDDIKISKPSGSELWENCHKTNSPLICWECGIKADRFIARRHKNDINKPPVLDLFAHTKHALVMMTRDHIIPVSLGGLDDVRNLRPACERCNGARKNKMNSVDQEFMDKNTHLWKKK